MRWPPFCRFKIQLLSVACSYFILNKTNCVILLLHDKTPENSPIFSHPDPIKHASEGQLVRYDKPVGHHKLSGCQAKPSSNYPDVNGAQLHHSGEGNLENQTEVHCTILSGKDLAAMFSMVAVAISSPMTLCFLCSFSHLYHQDQLTRKWNKSIVGLLAIWASLSVALHSIPTPSY